MRKKRKITIKASRFADRRLPGITSINMINEPTTITLAQHYIAIGSTLFLGLTPLPCKANMQYLLTLHCKQILPLEHFAYGPVHYKETSGGSPGPV